MTDDPATIFQEARRLAETDRRAAIELFKRVVDLPAGPDWADAQLEVAGWAHEWDDLEEARSRFQSILDADPSVRSAQAWRTSAVMLCRVLEDLDRPVDPDLLRRGLEACEAETNEPDRYLAGVAAGQLARLELAEGRRESARQYLIRAADHYDAAGSMTAGPGAALQIAKLYFDDGDHVSARVWVERGLRHLADFPHGGRPVRDTREKLEALAQRLG